MSEHQSMLSARINVSETDSGDGGNDFGCLTVRMIKGKRALGCSVKFKNTIFSSCLCRGSCPSSVREVFSSHFRLHSLLSLQTRELTFWVSCRGHKQPADLMIRFSVMVESEMFI